MLLGYNSSLLQIVFSKNSKHFWVYMQILKILTHWCQRNELMYVLHNSIKLPQKDISQKESFGSNVKLTFVIFAWQIVKTVYILEKWGILIKHKQKTVLLMKPQDTGWKSYYDELETAKSLHVLVFWWTKVALCPIPFMEVIHFVDFLWFQ